MRPLNRPMFRYGGPIKEGIMSGMQDRPGYKKGSLIAGLVSKIPGGQALIDSGRGIIPKIFNKIKPTSVPKFRKENMYDLPIGMRGPMSQRATRIPFMERAGMFTKQNPYFVGATAPFAVSGALTATPPVLDTAGKIAKATALQVADLAVPDFIFDQDKYFENKKIAELNENIKQNKKNTKLNEKDLGTQDPPKIDRDAEIEANRKRYYKLMGIDKMKKGAVYDSLIDASNIIQQEGGDLKGALKSGSLQSQIINAISKNLDKSVDLKKQIDAAILKGEITKDINREKDQLTTELTKKKIQLADKQLLGGDLNETLTALETKQGIVLEGPELATLAIEKGIDVPAGHTFNSKDVASFLKDNPTLNVVDFVNDQNVKLQAAGKGTLDAGNYVVGKNIVVVGEDGSVIDIIT
jgi:hypothetical protein